MKIWKMWKRKEWGDTLRWNPKWPDAVSEDAMTVGVTGHLTPLPEVGDLVLEKYKSGNHGLFRFKTVEPCGSPHDMFFGAVEMIAAFPSEPDEEQMQGLAEAEAQKVQ